MAETYPEEVVVDTMQLIVALDVPMVLRASIERQSRDLMELASGLLDAGLDEEQVRTVIDRAYSSYRDELTSAIIGLREHNET
ncbi:MAG: hypothetical protein ACOH2H_21395 [Cypionkella sp.]